MPSNFKPQSFKKKQPEADIGLSDIPEFKATRMKLKPRGQKGDEVT